MNPKSLKNLIPNSERTAEELSEIGRKGGIASGVTRRHQAMLRKQLQQTLKDYFFLEQLTEQEYADYQRWKRYRRKKHQH